MSMSTTLPILAGETRIHTLPGRPDFMLIREIAEIVGVKPNTLEKAFRRYRERFPEGWFFVLSEAEFRSKWGHGVRTSRGKRTDLEQVGMTEKGAILLLSLITGPEVIAARISLIDSIFSRYEAEREAMRRELAVDRDAYINARVIRKRIMTAAAEGWSYTTLRDRYRYSNPELTTEVQAIRTRGYIPLTALPVPQYILRKLAQNKAWLDEHAEDTRQLLLGLEG